MKLDLLQENLNHGLSLVTRILSNKPSMPILSNVLLQAKDSKLTLTASNLETSIITSIGAKISQEGEFTLPGKTLAEIISSLSAEKVTLELNEGSIDVKSTSFSAKINGIPEAEYPKIASPTKNDENLLEIDKGEFIKAVSQVNFSTAQDEGRAVLTGVLFSFSKDGLTLAATDGFRLSVVRLAKVTKTKGDESSFIIPAKSLVEVSRILSEKTAEEKTNTIKIYLLEGSNQVVFDLGETEIYSRLIAGTFPQFEKIIPTNSNIKLSLSAQEFSKAIRLASIFARESANIVKLKIENCKLKISANAPQVGENESDVEAKIEGGAEDFSIAFNFHYLLDYLSCLSGLEITVEFSGPTAPGVFHSVSDKDFLHIIMPVRVQG